LSILRYGWT